MTATAAVAVLHFLLSLLFIFERINESDAVSGIFNVEQVFATTIASYGRHNVFAAQRDNSYCYYSSSTNYVKVCTMDGVTYNSCNASDALFVNGFSFAFGVACSPSFVAIYVTDGGLGDNNNTVIVLERDHMTVIGDVILPFVLPPEDRETFSTMSFSTDEQFLLIGMRPVEASYLIPDPAYHGVVYVLRYTNGAFALDNVLHTKYETGIRKGRGNFGYSLSQRENLLFIGGLDDSCDPQQPSDKSCVDAGAVFVFEHNALSGEWDEIAYVKKPFSVRAGDEFGISISSNIDNTLLSVGCPGDDNCLPGLPATADCFDSGSVYVFRSLDGGRGHSWQYATYIKADGEGNSIVNSRFGASVAMVDDAIIVGAPGARGSVLGGTAYIFNRGGPDYVWEQAIVLNSTAPSSANAHFGRVVTADDYIMILQDYVDSPALDASAIFYTFETVSDFPTQSPTPFPTSEGEMNSSLAMPSPSPTIDTFMRDTNDEVFTLRGVPVAELIIVFSVLLVGFVIVVVIVGFFCRTRFETMYVHQCCMQRSLWAG